jgi:hypothetical protein
MSLWGARCGKPACRVLRGEGGTRGAPRPPSTQHSHRRHSALGYLSPAEFERQESQRHDVVRGQAQKEAVSEAAG